MWDEASPSSPTATISGLSLADADLPITNYATLWVSNCTISGTPGGTEAINNFGALRVTNSSRHGRYLDRVG